MSTPAEKVGNSDADFKGQDRRSGDRRSGGDRRAEGEERRTGISVSRTFRRQSFFDHPSWVAATVLIGVILGVVLMSVTGLQAPVRKSSAIEMKIVPEAATK